MLGSLFKCSVLTNDLVIFLVGADPSPVDGIAHQFPDGAVVGTYSRGVEGGVSGIDALESQTPVAGFCLKS